jgi:hypothetical protein
LGGKIFLREAADDATDVRKAGSLLQQESHVGMAQYGRGHLVRFGKSGIIGGARHEMR